MKPSPGTDAGGGVGAREVSRMLGLTVAQVRAWVRSGLVDPERGPKGELRFSEADLSLLRAARGLAGARIGLGAETPVGPVRFEYGAVNEGRGTFFVRIGRWF